MLRDQIATLTDRRALEADTSSLGATGPRDRDAVSSAEISAQRVSRRSKWLPSLPPRTGSSGSRYDASGRRRFARQRSTLKGCRVCMILSSIGTSLRASEQTAWVRRLPLRAFIAS